MTQQPLSQAPIFDTPPGSAQQPLTGQSDAARRPRQFYYDGQLFEDPGPEYSPQDILNFLAATYPELRQGSWTRRTLPDGSEEITFHKVTGEKGLVPRADQ
jgi:PRTRC genetic system protein C